MTGAVGRLPYPVVAAGPEAVRAEMARQAAAGRRFLVADALEDDHLRTLGAAAWDLPLVLMADAKTPHQAVMTALDVASQLGLTRFSFAANRTPGAP